MLQNSEHRLSPRRDHMDRLSSERRSWLMSQIRSKDTTPERMARSLLHKMGFRFRLHAPDLPGTPDIVFRTRKKVIFIHGCFWHGHHCKRSKMPKSRIPFWDAKIQSNRARDLRNRRHLRLLGWQTLVLWECQVKRPGRVDARLQEFLKE
jgi:DNA mismatch endonuclease (patch repair protein)